MNVALFLVIGAALLTIILSPTFRGPALRALFYRDLPATPDGHQPKFYRFLNGVRI